MSYAECSSIKLRPFNIVSTKCLSAKCFSIKGRRIFKSVNKVSWFILFLSEEDWIRENGIRAWGAGRHDTQHNDIYHNNTHRKQHSASTTFTITTLSINDTQNNVTICAAQLYFVVYTEWIFIFIMLIVVTLNVVVQSVVAPYADNLVFLSLHL